MENGAVSNAFKSSRLRLQLRILRKKKNGLFDERICFWMGVTAKFSGKTINYCAFNSPPKKLMTFGDARVLLSARRALECS